MKDRRITKRIAALIMTFALCFSLIPATSLAAAPSAPKGFKGAALSTSSIKLTWKKVSKAKSYTIYRKSGSKYVKLVTLSSKYSSYTVKKLKAGTKYYYKIAVKTSKGTSKMSPAIGVKTKARVTTSTPVPTVKPEPTPTPRPAPVIDQSLLGKWHIASLSPSMTLDFEYRADGTFEYTVVSIIYSTSKVNTYRGDYSAKNGMVYCTNVTLTEVGFKKQNGIDVETSRISGKSDDFSYAYRLGEDTEGRYMQNNYAYDPAKRDPITDDDLKYRLQ